MRIEFTTQVFKEGKMFVALTPELEVSSCAKSGIILMRKSDSSA